MGMKREQMGNEELVGGYNVEVGVGDEYIGVVDVNEYG